jgi:uncharacterized membrane protein YbhN (UPF0104 family)
MLRAFVKIGISALLLYLLLRNRDLPALFAQMAGVNKSDLTAAALCYAAVALPSALRWSIVTASLGHRLDFGKSLIFILIGYFFNLTLVSSIGGDAIRMWKAYRAGLPSAIAVNGVIIERLAQVIAHLLIVVASIPILFERVDSTTMRAGIIGLLAVGAAGFAVLLMLYRLPPRLQRFRVAGAVARFSTSLRQILLKPAIALPAISLGLVNQITVVGVVCILANGLRLPVGFADCLIVVPAAFLVTALPLSISGWGLREGAFVAGFGYLGLGGTDALTLSVLFGLLNTIVRLPGGLIWLLTKDGERIGDL